MAVSSEGGGGKSKLTGRSDAETGQERVGLAAAAARGRLRWSLEAA